MATCPIDAQRDDRKSAAIAAANARAEPGAEVIGSFAFARELLRSPAMLQGGAGAEHVSLENPEHVSVFFLDGELHRKRRSQLARYFTPKAIRERHMGVMQRSTDALIAELQRKGSAQLDLMSMQLACDVAAEIVGLTESNPRGLADRIRMTFLGIGGKPGTGLARITKAVIGLWRTASFFLMDIRPAMAARRRAPQDDVISFCVQEGFSNKAVLIECMTYATAGMLTTREFIVMVAWHLFEREDLRTRFLTGGEAVQFAIIEEILRLEPVAAMLHRRAAEGFESPTGRTVSPGDFYGIDMRAANVDPEATGPCPFAIDPDRSQRQGVTNSWMSFGDGPHRCPGSQVALHETRLFCDALLRVPGIRLTVPPTVAWCAPIMGYELHGAIVECERG